MFHHTHQIVFRKCLERSVPFVAYWTFDQWVASMFLRLYLYSRHLDRQWEDVKNK